MHDISLHVLDLIENSVRAKATVIVIRMGIDSNADVLEVCVEDNGEGIRVPPEQVLNPFFTTSKRKKVGLGLSLFKAAAEMAGGHLTLSRSAALGGVAVKVGMRFLHVDRPPIGDLAETISTMVLMHPEVDFRLSVRCGERAFDFRLREFAQKKGLAADANVELASAVFECLRSELEIWKRYELTSSREKWRAVNRLFLHAGPGRLEQGADA